MNELSSTDFPEFETIRDRRTLILVKRDWKDGLLDDLRSDFASVPDHDRKVIRGRVPHFSYRPRRSDARVLVRTGSRGGQISFLGNTFLGTSRPLYELRMTESALKAGLQVPEIVAVKITRIAPGFYRHLTVSREIESSRDLLDLLSHGEILSKRPLLRAVAEAVSRMHEAGISHGDLNVKNILIQKLPPDIYNVYLVDLDRSRHHPPPLEPERRLENLNRLFRSVEKCLGNSGTITRTDRARFVQCYASRVNARYFMKNCGHGLWMHRLWWAVAGTSPKRT